MICLRPMWVQGVRIETGQVIRLDPLEASSVYQSGRGQFSTTEDAIAARDAMHVELVRQGKVNFAKKDWVTRW